ncbi:hypothetical protein JR316_0001639 [Psilocybe cubensis]|nr:hypothetical protein JR316_0001639 [Psilocybe cubensis]KAH9484739.1 hypothetical protein JR316_0001639 [Psilocybe cubensis]
MDNTEGRRLFGVNAALIDHREGLRKADTGGKHQKPQIHSDLISTPHTAFSFMDITTINLQDQWISSPRKRKTQQKDIEFFFRSGKNHIPRKARVHRAAMQIKTPRTFLFSKVEAKLTLYQWATIFEEHRCRIQTSLALYSSLFIGAFGSVMINRKATLAFSLFPELDPLRKDWEEESSIEDEVVKSTGLSEKEPYRTVQNPSGETPFYKFNPSSTPSTLPHTRSRATSLSSYVTARDATSFINTLSSRYSNLSNTFDGKSSYSVASSRTGETDYGLYYRRMALSLISLNSIVTVKEMKTNLRRSRSWTSTADTWEYAGTS